MKKHLKKFGSGILIGISNLIPGFSGGTMALILGILEEFTDAVSLFTKHPLKSIKELWSLGLGMVIGIIIATFTVVVCLEKWPIITASFFVGLVLASMRIALKEIKGETPKISDYISALICFLVSISLPFLKKLGFEINILNPNILIMIYIFVVACIAAATMMIPAASGSLIMLAFGIFASILKELKDSVLHCEEVIKQNADRLPILEKTNKLLTKQVNRLTHEIGTVQDAIKWYDEH
jgi:putative membrane protein